MTARRWLLAAVLGTVSACGRPDETPRAVGMLESDRIEIVAEFFEPIIGRAVREGDSVQAGQILLSQDPARAEARVEAQEARLAGARARLAELTRGPRREQISAASARVDAARQDLEFRRRNYERARTIYERDLAAVETVDRAKTLLDTAAANVNAEQARLEELLTGTTIEELDQASAEVRRAEAELKAAEIDRRRHDAVAPVDARVDTLPFEIGERPQPGQPVAVLLGGSQPYARAYVPERLRATVRPGDVATVHVDGLDIPLTGRVRWVSSDAAFTPYFALTRYDRGRLTYAAKIDLDFEDGRLPDGVPVEVEFGSESAP